MQLGCGIRILEPRIGITLMRTARILLTAPPDAGSFAGWGSGSEGNCDWSGIGVGPVPPPPPLDLLLLQPLTRRAAIVQTIILTASCFLFMAVSLKEPTPIIPQ